MDYSPCKRLSNVKLDLRGYIRPYIDGITANWLLIAPDANPAMLEMFSDRDRLPYRDLVPWAGEFAAKYLIAATQMLQLNRDPRLKNYLQKFVNQLIQLQDSDGYLGPWPRAYRLELEAPNSCFSVTWDAWAHYLMILGLVYWFETSGDSQAFESAKRIGDMLCTRFLNSAPGRRIVDKRDTEMNLAAVHGLAVLYRMTKEKRYLDLALQLVAEFEIRDFNGKPLAGDYLNQALAGKEYFEMPKPRWESIHSLLAFPELYQITGDDRFRKAFEHDWWSIVKFDRHNNGGFSSGEKAQGNPYHQGAIETCCTIAWILMSIEMLKLTGNSIVADELELSLMNSVVGMHNPTGRWVTYNTPMDGVRKASFHDIVFQSREGAPELNCCSVNSPRGFGLIREWAIMEDSDGLILNWYGPGKINAELSDGSKVTIRQITQYPRKAKIKIIVELPSSKKFSLKLRIPNWSKRTKVEVNGVRVESVQSGTYLPLDRVWEPGDQITLQFDFTPTFWIGEQECEKKVSIFRGPILLTYDRNLNRMDPAVISPINTKNIKENTASLPPSSAFILVDLRCEDGSFIRLCDFGSAGSSGSPYMSWLPAITGHPIKFSRENPLRMQR